MQRANAYQRQLKAMKREEEKAEEDIFRVEMVRTRATRAARATRDRAPGSGRLACASVYTCPSSRALRRSLARSDALASLPFPPPCARAPSPRQLAKFAEDDRIEQMNAQRRRMKQLEHRKEIERLLDERRAAFERERDTAVQEFEADAAREHERISIVEEERQRILRAHAAVLGLHDLPKGVLKNERDAALFSQFGASPGAHAAQQRQAGAAASVSNAVVRETCADSHPTTARDAPCLSCRAVDELRAMRESRFGNSGKGF
jgi:hypothetical protein